MRFPKALLPLTCTLYLMGSAPAFADGSGSSDGSALVDAGTPDAPSVQADSSSTLPVVDGDDTDLAKRIYQGVTTKNWFLALGAALALLTHGVRWLLLKKWPTWSKDRWGWALAGGMAGFTALSLAWMADASASSADTLLGALKLFASSVFAYVTTKKLATPDTQSA